MDILLKFCCLDCDGEFVVLDDLVESDSLNCPYCNGEIEVPQDGDEDDD